MVKRKSRRRAGGSRAWVLANKNVKDIRALKKKLNKCCGRTDVKKEEDPYEDQKSLDFEDFEDFEEYKPPSPLASANSKSYICNEC